MDIKDCPDCGGTHYGSNKCPQATTALKQAVREFEGRFKIIVEFSPTQFSASLAPPPCDKRYTTYANGVEKNLNEMAPWVSSADEAVAEFAKNIMALDIGAAKALFWRKRPKLEKDFERMKWMVYCRLAFC
jgi:hypothetical protein